MRFSSLLLLVSSIILFGAFAFADDGTSVVVNVNGVDLTNAELNQEINKIVPMEKNFHGGMSDQKLLDIKKRALNILIDMELKYQDGLSKGQKLDKKAISREIDLLASKFPVREAFEEAVQQAGLGGQAMERFVSRNIIAKKMKELEVDNKVSVTDSMISDYYNTNKSKYMKPEEYRASIILLKVPASALQEEREEFRKKADDVYQQLKNGSDFSVLASKYSDDNTRINGGDLGYFHAGQADDTDFDAQIQKIKVGEISGVIKSLKGFYIVKLTDKKQSRQIPFEEMKDKIKLTLVNLQKESLYASWMDSLKKKAKVVYTATVQTEKGSTH